MTLITHPFDPQRPLQRWSWVCLGSVAVAEMAARAGPDAVVIDLQHGLWERQAVDAAVAVAGAQVPVLVRCADAGAAAIGTALDSGASALLVPLVETADETRRILQHAHYPPRGTRSGGGVRPLMHGLAGMLQAGAGIRVGVMIETARGVREAAAICAVPGLDFVFIGTGDLSLSLGTPSGPELDAACEQVRLAAQRHGVPCGRFTADAADCTRWLAAGYHHAVAASDVGLLTAGFAQAAGRSSAA